MLSLTEVVELIVVNLWKIFEFVLGFIPVSNQVLDVSEVLVVDD